MFVSGGPRGRDVLLLAFGGRLLAVSGVALFFCLPASSPPACPFACAVPSGGSHSRPVSGQTSPRATPDASGDSSNVPVRAGCEHDNEVSSDDSICNAVTKCICIYISQYSRFRQICRQRERCNHGTSKAWLRLNTTKSTCRQAAECLKVQQPSLLHADVRSHCWRPTTSRVTSGNTIQKLVLCMRSIPTHATNTDLYGG